MAAKPTTKGLKKTAKRAKKSVRRGSKKAKKQAGKAADAVKRGAKKAKKAVKRATKKAKKTARRAKKAVRRATKKAKRKARKVRTAAATAEVAAVRRAVAETNASFVAAIGRQDAAGAARVYTEDAKILPPGSPIVEGREAIRDFWAGALDQLGVTGVQLETVELGVRRDAANEIGRYAISSATGVIDEGKYVVLWKREPGGSWRWHVDIWNSSRPAPA